MSLRPASLLSILLAVWLLLSGLPTPAQASAVAEHGPAAELLWAGALAGDDEGPAAPATPAAPEALGERDSLVDLPELFDLLRSPTRPGAVASNLPCPRLATPPAPYLEGLRRPPRSSQRPA